MADCVIALSADEAAELVRARRTVVTMRLDNVRIEGCGAVPRMESVIVTHDGLLMAQVSIGKLHGPKTDAVVERIVEPGDRLHETV